MDFREGISWCLVRIAKVLDNAKNDLTEEEASYRPCRACNSIGATLIHCGRAEDGWASRITGQEEIWLANGWADKFRLPKEDRGWSYDDQSPEERRPVAELVGYFTETNTVFLQILKTLPEERMSQMVEGRSLSLSVDKVFTHVVTELNQHLGQIDYVRGMLGKNSAITGTPPPKAI